ncbi:MAG: DUF1566 domain-containing protein [Tannerellaceae bacterium]|nr:DUF1566 domain-containing protein [Tannerellaceae bacterium]
MKLKTLALSFLACILITACSDDDYRDEIAGSPQSITLDIDIDYLTDTYGPALTRNLSALNGISTYALPSTINDISLVPGGEIPPEEETKTIIITGSFSTVPVRASDAVNDAGILSEVLVVNSGGIGYASMIIPRYESTELGSVRIVMFEYFNYETNKWEPFEYAVQYAIFTEVFRPWSDIKEDIPKEGGKYTIHISGDFPSKSSETAFFRAVDAKGKAISPTVAIIGTTQKSVLLTIEENMETSSRVVYLEYLKSTEKDFVRFETHVQLVTPSVAPDDFVITHNLSSPISGNGGTYSLYLNGVFNGNQVLVWAYETGTNKLLSEYVSLSSTNRSGTLKIAENDTKNSREIGIKYSPDLLATESLLGIFTQEGSTVDNFVIPGTNVYLAKDNANSNGMTGSPLMNWAQANGISETYLTSEWTVGTNKNYPTGCNGYYEKSDASDKGLWRLPSKEELTMLVKEIFRTQYWHGMSHNENYWTIDKFSTAPQHADYVWYLNFPSPTTHSFDGVKKSVSAIKSRCVREK